MANPNSPPFTQHTGKEEGKKNVFFMESGRFLTYGFFVFQIAELMRWNAKVDESDVKFSEFSHAEYAQSLLLVLCSSICIGFYLSKNTKTFRYIFLAIFGLSTAALIREQDIYFEQLFGHGIWLYPVILISGFVAYSLYTERGNAWEQLVRYMSTKSYAFMTFGILTIFIFSRLYGRTVFWQQVMEEKYFRSVKNVSEESIELYGYLFLFYAVVELVILEKGTRKY